MPTTRTLVGEVLESSNNEVTFTFADNPRQPKLLTGAHVETNSFHPETQAEAYFNGTIEALDPNSSTAVFVVRSSIIDSRWPANIQAPRPGDLVYQTAVKPARSRKSRQQASRPAPPAHPPYMVTCENCRTLTNSLPHHPENPISYVSEQTTCPNCGATAPISRATTGRPTPLYQGNILCAKRKHPLQVMVHQRSASTIYLCLPCATRISKRHNPPFLYTGKADRLITYTAVSSALRSLDLLSVDETDDPMTAPGSQPQLISFLLSQINHRKRSLLAFSEQPGFAYQHVQHRVELLLEHQDHLETDYRHLTGTGPDPDSYPQWDAPDANLDFITSTIQNVHLDRRRLTINYKQPILTQNSPDRPATRETIEFYEHL